MIPNGPYKSIGRIEFCINGTWGTICSDFFDDNDAMVLCRQLGYSTLGNKELNICVCSINYFHCSSGAQSMGNVSGESVLPFHIIDLNCTGDEESVWDCPSNALLSQYSCNQNNDAALSCLKS